jgi:hypothetical protein
VERNSISHPTIVKSELSDLKTDFMQHCEYKWPQDTLNIILTNDIFDELQRFL